MQTRGHCLCKKTTWSFEGDAIWSCYCHCDDCRRNCGAPVVAWLGVPFAQFTWTGDTPSRYESSTGVFRHFCETCGSPLAFEAAHYPGDISLYSASLDNPEDFKPTFHVNYQTKLHWLTLDDDLKKYDETVLHMPQDLSDDE